ncbi:hypothetical protein KR067_012979 [Drosophila pandora]|nr:hypothetical protein KR067_012979 [Drosophila pandora]
MQSITVCGETDNERLNDVDLACAELTTRYNVLSKEWIAALQSLCSGTGNVLFFSPNPLDAVGNDFSIRLSCDRHLLVGAHKTISIAAVLAVLIAILIVVDNAALKTSLTAGGSLTSGGLGGAFGSARRSGFSTPVHPGTKLQGSNEQRPAALGQILGASDLHMGSSLTIEPELTIERCSNHPVAANYKRSHCWSSCRRCLGDLCPGARPGKVP